MIKSSLLFALLLTQTSGCLAATCPAQLPSVTIASAGVKDKGDNCAATRLLAQAQPVTIAPAGVTDYVDSIGARADYWHHEKMPIKVLILADPKVPNYRAEFKDYFLSACKSWQSAAQGKIQFKFVQSEPCDIKVSWTNDLSQVQKGELGEAGWENDQDGLYKATIKLLTLNQTGTRPISDPEAKAMCLHELGHALGIARHSPYLGDIMNAAVDVNFKTPVEKIDLSERDKATISRLYAEGDALLDRLAEQTTDNKAKIIRMCFQADRLIRAEKYDPAFELLEKILAIEPTCVQALSDMNTCSFEQGMDCYANGDYAKAINRLQKFLSTCQQLKAADGPQQIEAREAITKCQAKMNAAKK